MLLAKLEIILLKWPLSFSVYVVHKSVHTAEIVQRQFLTPIFVVIQTVHGVTLQSYKESS